MRTVIFILALAVHDIAVTQGAPKLDYNFWGWVFIVFVIFDVAEFLYKKR